MPHISVQTDESQAVAAKFEGHAATAQEIITDIQNAILNGLPGWQGAAKEAFITQFTQLKPYLQNFVNLAQGQAMQLRAHSSGSEEHDNFYAQQYLGGAY